MAADMNLNMALPCRISVYTIDGVIHIGMIRPSRLLNALSDDEPLSHTAADVEQAIKRMIDEAIELSNG